MGHGMFTTICQLSNLYVHLPIVEYLKLGNLNPISIWTHISFKAGKTSTYSNPSFSTSKYLLSKPLNVIVIFPTTHVISKSSKVSRLAIGWVRKGKQLFSFFLVRAEDCPSHRPWSFMLTPRPPAVALVVAWVNHGPAQLYIPLFQPNFNQVGHLILEICFLTKDTVTTNKSWMLFDLKREKVKKTLSRHLLTHSLKRRFGYSLTPRSKEFTPPGHCFFCSSPARMRSPQPPPGTFVEFPTVDIEELLRSRLIGAVIRITSAFSTERLLF